MVSASIKQFDMSLHGGNSAADFARELFKPLNSQQILKSAMKNIFWFWVYDFLWLMQVFFKVF